MKLSDLDKAATERLAAYVDDLGLGLSVVANIFALTIADTTEALVLGRERRSRRSDSTPREQPKRVLRYAVMDRENSPVQFGTTPHDRYAVYYQGGRLCTDPESNAWGGIALAFTPSKMHADLIAAALNAYAEIHGANRGDHTPEDMRRLIYDLNSTDLNTCRSEMLAVGVVKPKKG